MIKAVRFIRSDF